MSCLNFQPLQKPLNNPFKDIPAGKPTYSEKSNFCKLYYEPSTMEFKTSKRRIDHRNKTSIFDSSRTYINGSEKVLGPTDHKNFDIQSTLKKRIIVPSTLEIKNLFQNESKDIPIEKYGKRINQDIRNLYIFSQEQNNANEKRSSRRISNYSLEKNPCKWGVDVLKYGLPSPKRIHRHVDNLSSCLVPRKGEDTIIPQKKRSHCVTQLEKSLCPKENSISNSSKKFIHPQESKLEVNYVPKDFEKKKTLNKPKYHHGNLSTDLTPVTENNRKSFHINTTCRNKKCSISFNCNREPSPYRSGKRIGYMCAKKENSVFLF